MFWLDGASGVEASVGLFTKLIDRLEVVNHVLVGLQEVELLLECGNNLVLCLVVFLEQSFGTLVEGVVEGIASLGVAGNAEGYKNSSELSFLVDNIPV